MSRHEVLAVCCFLLCGPFAAGQAQTNLPKPPAAPVSPQPAAPKPAETPSVKTPPPQEVKPGKGAIPAQQTDVGRPTEPAVPLDPETAKKQQESLQAAYEYQISAYAHAQKTFDWQYRSTRIIFWVVLLLVAAGLVFSALQFYLGFTRPGSGPDASRTELEASLQGIKVSSSVLGVIVLAISMIFFYLYLRYVYPISNVPQ